MAIKDWNGFKKNGDTYIPKDATAREGLTGKVDKVTGKGLSTNDYDATAKGIVDNIQNNVIANTKLIKDTVGWSGKNKFDTSKVTWAQFTYTNGEIKNNATDTREILMFAVQGRKNGTYVKHLLTGTSITATGKQEFTFTIEDSDDINQLYIGHNGASSDLRFIFPFTEKGTYKISFNAIGINPTVVNGIVLTEMMIRDADILDDTYEPYHESVKDTLREAEVIEGENLLPIETQSKTIRDVTFTVNTDGSIDVNGTANGADVFFDVFYDFKKYPAGKYILSGTPVGGSLQGYGMKIYRKSPSYVQNFDIGSGVEVEYDAEYAHMVQIFVANGANVSNKKFYPMLRLATEEDSTFKPYYIPLKDSMFPRSEQAVLGAKNIAPINVNTITNKGITLTVNADKTITVSGTATEAVAFEISAIGQWLENGKQYKLSGCKGGSSNTYKLDVAYVDTGILAVNYDEDEVLFTANNARNYVMRIVVYAGQTMNNVVIKPMVRLATDTDPTYAPPAMTNMELSRIKYIKINYTYETQIQAGSQQKEVITNIPRDKVLMVSAECGSTNDTANICYVADNKVYFCITNVFGHTASTTMNGTLYLIYKE